MIQDQRESLLKVEVRSRAAIFNSTQLFDPYFASTGVRTHDLRHTSQLFSNESRLAELFLQNTKLKKTDREGALSVNEYRQAEFMEMLALNGNWASDTLSRLPLDDRTPIKPSLQDAIERRRSYRLYSGDPMDLPDLASILYAANGITGELTFELPVSGGAIHDMIKLRSVGSGGGLYPLDIYIVANNVKKLEKGLYYYNPIRGTLELLKKGEDIIATTINCFAIGEEMINFSRANVIVVLTARIWSSMKKYGDRGLRYIFIEVGEIAQNVHLAITALGYGSVDVQAFYDDALNELIGLDGTSTTAVHALVIGVPVS